MLGPVSFVASIARNFPNNTRVDQLRSALLTGNQTPNKRLDDAAKVVYQLTMTTNNVAKTTALFKAWRAYQAWHKRYGTIVFATSKKRTRPLQLNNLPRNVLTSEILARLNNGSLVSMAQARKNKNAHNMLAKRKLDALSQELYNHVHMWARCMLEIPRRGIPIVHHDDIEGEPDWEAWTAGRAIIIQTAARLAPLYGLHMKHAINAYGKYFWTQLYEVGDGDDVTHSVTIVNMVPGVPFIGSLELYANRDMEILFDDDLPRQYRTVANKAIRDAVKAR